MATSLPALPTDSQYAPPGGAAGVNGAAGGVGGASPFSGGLPEMMQAVQGIEAGYKMLVTILPSLAPIAAEAVSKLRVAVPNAVGAAAGQGGAPQPGQQAGGAPPLPAPPMQAQLGQGQV